MSVRLDTAVSSHSSLGMPVEVTLTAPVRKDGRQVLRPGALIRGLVDKAAHRAPPDGRSELRLLFQQFVSGNDPPINIKAVVAAVDNARETVEAGGVIRGLHHLSAKPTTIEDLMLLAAYAHPAILATAEGIKFLYAEEHRPQVTYGPGVDMTLSLLADAEFTADPDPITSALTVSPELAAIIAAQPLRTMAERPRQPSDMTNLMFLGSGEALQAAFTDGAWTPAAAATLRTDTITFLAICDHHSYREAPVSTLLLDTQKPDLVFEKQTNTFSKRHHIRIWKRPQVYNGQPVWVGAATHDVGIDFSREARTFTHRVEHDVDRERTKVVNDLCFTKRVAGVAMVPRPDAALAFENATGDTLQTDGAIAVLQLGSSTPPSLRRGL